MAAKLTYIGPEYKTGIKINGIVYRPKEWTAKEQQSFIKSEPRLSDYFEATKAATDSDK